MVNRKNKIVIKGILLYIINVLCLSPIMIYGGQNFSVDSYGIALDYKEHIEAFIGSYRWFGAFAYEIYHKIFNHNPITDSTIDCIVFIVLVAASVSLLSYTLYKLLKTKSILSYVVINVSVLISVLNVWFCDILSFPECVFITAIGTVLCFSAVIVFAKNQTVVGYILSSVLIILATGVYQQFLFVFTIFVVAICGCEVIKNNEKTLKELFFRYVRPVVLILVSGIIYFIIASGVREIYDIKPTNRAVSGIPSIVSNIVYFVTHQPSYIKGRGFFKGELMTICFVAIGVIWLLSILLNWFKQRHTLKTIVLCASYACAYVSAYATLIISEVRSLRGLFPLFTVFALFAIGSLILTNNKLVRVLLCTILVVVLSVNTGVFTNLENNQKKQNDVDKYWCLQIINQIEEYEKNSQTITQIYYCYDNYLDLSTYSNSAISDNNSPYSIIKVYSSREFMVKTMTAEDKERFFGDKEWTEINIEEQMIFVDDTLYLCCY